MQLDANQTHRLTATRLVHRRILQITRVDKRDPTATDDFEFVTALDEGRRIFVEAKTNGERVVSKRSQKASKTVALAKMLIDDERIGQPEARRHIDHVRTRRTAFLATRDHMFRHERRTRRRTSNMHALGIATPDRLRNSRAADRRGKTQLVTTGHENTVTFLDVLEVVVRLAVLKRHKVQ